MPSDPGARSPSSLSPTGAYDMQIRDILLAGAAAALLTASTALAAPTIGTGGITLGSTSSAFASADEAAKPGGGTQTDDGRSTPTATDLGATGVFAINSRTAATNQSADGATTAGASAYNMTSAEFASPASAIVRFDGGSSALTTGANGIASASNGYYFQYSFDNDADAGFQLEYDLSGPVLGCCGNSIQLYDYTTPASVIYHTLYDTDLTGTLTAQLLAGHQYRLDITKGEYSSVDAAYVNGPGSQSFSHADRFAFRIGDADPVAPVPEPASWAMMIGGFDAVGSALRRRSNARTACLSVA